MSVPSQSPPHRSPAPDPKDEMPTKDELSRIAAKSLQTGALAGVMGSVVGFGSGIMRSAPPALFAIVAGVQWFALGSSYMASRDLLWHAWGGEQNLTSGQKIQASAAAGGVSGMVGGIIRGPSNIIPGIIFWSAVGGGASFAAQKFQNREPRERTSFLASKWSPLKPLSDQEYERLLEEKLLRLEADIAIIDENIAALKFTDHSQPKSEGESRVTAPAKRG